VGHRSYHRWSRWWARRGTRSLSLHYFYSYLLMEYIKPQNTESSCTTRDRWEHILFQKKIPSKKIKKMSRYQGTWLGWPVVLFAGFPCKSGGRGWTSSAPDHLHTASITCRVHGDVIHGGPGI
jgi:hypothetical protein